MSLSYTHGNIAFEFERMKVFSEFQLEKNVDYSSIQNCMWACHFISSRNVRLVYKIKVRE